MLAKISLSDPDPHGSAIKKKQILKPNIICVHNCNTAHIMTMLRTATVSDVIRTSLNSVKRSEGTVGTVYKFNPSYALSVILFFLCACKQLCFLYLFAFVHELAVFIFCSE